MKLDYRSVVLATCQETSPQDDIYAYYQEIETTRNFEDRYNREEGQNTYTTFMSQQPNQEQDLSLIGEVNKGKYQNQSYKGTKDTYRWRWRVSLLRIVNTIQLLWEAKGTQRSRTEAELRDSDEIDSRWNQQIGLLSAIIKLKLLMTYFKDNKTNDYHCHICCCNQKLSNTTTQY